MIFTKYHASGQFYIYSQNVGIPDKVNIHARLPSLYI